MAYQFHYTPTGTGAISGKEVLEQTEDAINDLGNTAISSVQEALYKAEQALTNSENAVDDAQTALNTANNAEGVAIQAQTDVGNLSGTVTNIGNRVTTAEGNISNLQGRMTTAEGNITNLQGRMTTAETNIGNLQTAVSTAQATANSAQQTAATARQQSYVFRYSSTALTDSSTNSNTLLDNTDNLKVGDKVIDSSGVLFSITAIDTQNSTFTIGTALIDLALDANVVHTSEINSSGIGIIEAVKEVGGVDFNTLTTQGLYGANASESTNNPENSPCVVQVIKRQNSVIQIANVSSSAYKSRYIRYCADITAQSPVWQSWIKFATDDNVMHLSGDESASGIKSFIGTRTEFKRSNNDGVVLFNNDSFVKGDTPSDTIYLCRKYYGGSTSIPTAIGYSSVTVSEQGNRSMIQLYCLANTSGSTSRTTLQMNYDKSLQGADAQYFNLTGSLFPGANNSYSLGNSSNKWKQINGINPGALSFPDLDNGIDISGYITAGYTHNEYTPLVDGWISVILKKTTSSGPLAIFLYQGDVGNSYFGNTSLPNETEFCGMASIPVKAGAVVNIDLKGSNIYVYSAKFYPCQGNV